MKLTKPLFWLLTILWFAAGAWWYSRSECSNCSTKTAPITNETISAATSPGILIQDSGWTLKNADNLRFPKSAAAVVMSPVVSNLIDSLAIYNATLHPEKQILITGYYSSAEKNNTSFENLGIARATALKNILIKKQVAEKNIVVQSGISNDLFFTPTDTLVGGIGFAFSNKLPNPNSKQDLLFEPRLIYFNSGKNSLPVNAEFVKYIQDVKAYLLVNKDKKLSITGYTDNIGDPEKNKQLSAARASFVKSELSHFGIGANQIQTEGKGMADPIADNNSEAGRAKNRRVSIALQ